MNNSSGLHSPWVVAAVALPPPLHGQSFVNAEIIAKLENSGYVLDVVDISPGNVSRGWSYHSNRLIKVMKAALSLISSGWRQAKVFYTILEAGSGVYYNYFLLGLARLFAYRILIHHHSALHTLQASRQFENVLLVGGPMTHIVLSERMANDLRARYPSVEKALICHNASLVPNPGEPIRSPRISSSLRIGHLSNLSGEKGLDTVVETIIVGREQGLRLNLVLAGPAVGASHETIRKAQEALGDSLDFRGPVSGGAKADFFGAIDVFFFPTRYAYEAQPLVVLEAMSYGVPVVVTDHGYISECVGLNGIVLSGTSQIPEKALAAFRALMDPKILLQKQTLARRRYLQLREQSFVQYERLLDEIFEVVCQ